MSGNFDTPGTSVKRALLSVTNKEGLLPFAAALADLGIEIVSTGGTRALLEGQGIAVVPLERFTGSAEMLDGRVKTLHPLVHGGILARRDVERHRREVEAHAIRYIDLVAVNLYDFEGAVARPGATFEEILEHIDIGGPALLRAAAKNHAFVIPVVDPRDYPKVIEALRARRPLTDAVRRSLALKVYRETSRYDRAVSEFFERALQPEASELSSDAGLPELLGRRLRRLKTLRYGENPHQSAGFYSEEGRPPRWLAKASQLQGKELSYNNLLDLDSALGLASDLGGTTAVFIKHNNPCGAASRDSLFDAVKTARACDAVSAFGAVVAVTRTVDARTAELLTEAFLEVILAPSYDAEALSIFARKANLRVLALGEEDWAPLDPVRDGLDVRAIRGGFLVQSRDAAPTFRSEVERARVVTKRAPNVDERAGLAFAWVVAKHVRSNAIVFGDRDRVVAIGAGQMSRVDSVKLCQMKGGDALRGTVAASDAFFPFRDGVDVLAAAGATAIVQPGGSIRDEEVIRAADEHGVAMIFTDVRHFRH